MNTLPDAPHRPAHLLCLSAHDEPTFRRRADSLAEHLGAVDPGELNDVCFTLHTTGEHHGLRAWVIGKTGAELANGLRRAVPRACTASNGGPRIALMFTGQGSQYPRMAQGLYAADPRFRAAFDDAAACFGRELGATLRDLVLNGGASADRLAQTDLTQPALFAIDYAVGRMLLDWGVRPHCMLGHSIGEYAAACLAGVFDVQSAARLVSARGRLMHELPARGAMIAVFAPASEVESLLEPFRDRLFMAAYNGSHVVVAGELAAFDALKPSLDAAGRVHRRLAVSHAFHTPYLQPMVDPFRQAFQGIAVGQARVKIVSNVTGDAFTGPFDAAYWARHVLEPVRFEQSVHSALRDGVQVFVEAGPDRVLTGMCRGLLGDAAVALPTLQRKGEDWTSVLVTAGELYQRGAALDFREIHGERARRVRGLPPYPLARSSLGRPGAGRMVPPAAAQEAQETSAPPPPICSVIPSVWVWEAEVPRPRAVEGHGRLLVVAPERLLPHLERALGRAGDRWLPAPIASGSAIAAEELVHFLTSADREGPIRGALVLLGAWSGERDPAWNEGIELGVHRLALLVKSLREARGVGAMPLVLVTRGAMGVSPDDATLEPWQSPAIAVVQGLALEEPWLDARALDLPAGAPDEMLVRAALQELAIVPNEERLVAIRSSQRLARSLRPAPAQVEPWRPEDGETYLLTGAASGIGAALALHLARSARVQMIITGRRPLGSSSGPGESGGETAERVQLLRDLKQAGARVRYEAVDTADGQAMADMVRRTRAELGPIRGVVHCAGVVDAQALRLTDKTWDGLWRVLSPKVRGVAVLDEVTRGEPLRFFAAFSSVAASRTVWGKSLADYSAANFFLDQYCLMRAARGGPGRTVAINWSLWRATGMGRVPGLDAIAERSGLEPLEPSEALRAFDEAIGREEPVLHVYRAGRAHTEVAPARSSQTRPPRPPAAGAMPVHRTVLEVLAEQFRRQASEIDPTAGFHELGLDSLGAMEALRKLEVRLGVKLNPTIFFEFRTPKELIDHLAPLHPPPSPSLPSTGAKAEAGLVRSHAHRPARVEGAQEIAIVGLACRFPGADGPEAYWELLRSGRSAIGEAPAHRFDSEIYFDPTGAAAHASYSRWGAFIPDPYAFDALFFGISPREAVAMDPQQRLFLEVAWQAVQRAGYARERPADMGVFVGCESNAYSEHFTGAQRHAAILGDLTRAPWFQALGDPARAHLTATLARHLAPGELTSDVVAGNGLNCVAARVSHFLDVHGPSFILNSACSSSLLAIHFACESLRRGETSMAIAGGVFLNLGTSASVILSKIKALSPTGACRPFDRRADGMVLGEGGAAFVLKPLPAALRDGDHVHAVVRGSGVSNDGRASGITVPTGAGQAEAINRAYQQADVDPMTVSYVECHGTATPLGDPIELQGLVRAIGCQERRPKPCLIGSAKGSVGHALSAAGASSVLKVALALEAATIPPSAGYEEPSPHIDFGPFQVVQGAPRPWISEEPRRAGVNAFGFGGTNCHVILEEAPPVTPTRDGGGPHLLCLYARTPDLLRRWADGVKRALLARPEIPAEGVCASLQKSQPLLAHVAAGAVRDRDDLLAALEAVAGGLDRAGLHRGRLNPRHPPRLELLLGTDWLPSRADAEALSRECPRLAAPLSDALSALRDPGMAERMGLVAQYAAARALGELGLPLDRVTGQGLAGAVAACLRGEISLAELARGARRDAGPPASTEEDGLDAAKLVLELGSPARGSEPRSVSTGSGSAALIQADRAGIGRHWALDLFARLLAGGAALSLRPPGVGAHVHVPLADHPFERRTYQAFSSSHTPPPES